LYIDMKLNDIVEEGWRFCVETAGAHGLVAFDPQSAALANPDPNARPAASVPDDARQGWRGVPVVLAALMAVAVSAPATSASPSLSLAGQSRYWGPEATTHPRPDDSTGC
jgi:hypothetical protein